MVVEGAYRHGRRFLFDEQVEQGGERYLMVDLGLDLVLQDHTGTFIPPAPPRHHPYLPKLIEHGNHVLEQPHP
jgi:hypothetical protein